VNGRRKCDGRVGTGVESVGGGVRGVAEKWGRMGSDIEERGQKEGAGEEGGKERGAKN